MSYPPIIFCGRCPMRPQGSPADLEKRRLRAIELLQDDVPVLVVADRVGVDRRSVRRWKRAYRRRGRRGVRGRPAPRRPSELRTPQRRELGGLVVAGPEAAGYGMSLWTCRRLVDLIRRHLCVANMNALRPSGDNPPVPGSIDLT